jgi:Fuc2NAc and GlcNAc transferase
MIIGVIAAIACGVSAVLTGLVRRYALRTSLLDVPNARSSHVRPTPRGGGIAIVVVSLAAMAVLVLFDQLDRRFFYALSGGGAAIAWVGYLDDRGRIGIVWRFVVHVAAAIWAVAFLGGMTDINWQGTTVTLGMLGPMLAVLGIVWSLNLFNFMDGIDGIAASQAVFMAGVGALLAHLAGLTTSIPAAGWTIAAASFGFLLWNWPPARVFMGDVGSGFLGFVLAVLALGATRESAVMLPVWLILGAVFIVDATFTLCRRLARRERFYEAHRSHAYQWLSRRWSSHLRVTAACATLNVLWLGPLAWICMRFPAYAGWCLLGAWAPLIAVAVAAGAGRRET